jgi:hypothetical protein
VIFSLERLLSGGTKLTWDLPTSLGSRCAYQTIKLLEDYGIHCKNPPARETSGIKRVAIMHDDGVNAFGFNGNKEQLVKWMIANRFAGLVCDYNLSFYD